MWIVMKKTCSFGAVAKFEIDSCYSLKILFMERQYAILNLLRNSYCSVILWFIATLLVASSVGCSKGNENTQGKASEQVRLADVKVNNNASDKVNVKTEDLTIWKEFFKDLPESKINFDVLSVDRNSLENDKLLVVHPYGGMSNRWMVMASSYAIAKLSRRKLILDWEADEHVPAPYDKILSSPHFYITKEFADPVPVPDRCSYKFSDVPPQESQKMTDPIIVLESGRLFSYAIIHNELQKREIRLREEDGKLFSYAFTYDELEKKEIRLKEKDGKLFREEDDKLFYDFIRNELQKREIRLRENDPHNSLKLFALYAINEKKELSFEWKQCDFLLKSGAHSPVNAEWSTYTLANSERLNDLYKDPARVIYLKNWIDMIPKKENLDDFINEYLNFFKQVVPANEILKSVISFYNNYMNDHEIVGVHYRSWNSNVENAFWAAQKLPQPPIEEFSSQIQDILKSNSKMLFFVASDKVEAGDELERKFPGHILRFTKTQVKRNTIEDVQVSLIDWFLLQRTNYIVGTYQSTFSDQASLMTREKRKVELGPDAFGLEKQISWEKVSYLVNGCEAVVHHVSELPKKCEENANSVVIYRLHGDKVYFCGHQQRDFISVTDEHDLKRLELEFEKNKVIYNQKTILNRYICTIFMKYNNGEKIPDLRHVFFKNFQ
jgi:hypothetical protein